MTKQFITNVLPNFKTSAVYKHAKKGTTSFRITQKLLQNITSQAKRLKNLSVLILTIPVNDKERYVLRCHITKEKI